MVEMPGIPTGGGGGGGGSGAIRMEEDAGSISEVVSVDILEGRLAWSCCLRRSISRRSLRIIALSSNISFTRADVWMFLAR